MFSPSAATPTTGVTSSSGSTNPYVVTTCNKSLSPFYKPVELLLFLAALSENLSSFLGN